MNTKPVGLVVALIVGEGASSVRGGLAAVAWTSETRRVDRDRPVEAVAGCRSTLAWQVNDIGDGYSSVAVVGDRLYTLGNLGLDNEFVRAMSVQDGKTLWTTRLGNVGNPDRMPSYPKARSTPTIEGERSMPPAPTVISCALTPRPARCAGRRTCGRNLAAYRERGRMPSHRWSTATWWSSRLVAPRRLCWRSTKSLAL